MHAPASQCTEGSSHTLFFVIMRRRPSGAIRQQFYKGCGTTRTARWSGQVFDALDFSQFQTAEAHLKAASMWAGPRDTLLIVEIQAMVRLQQANVWPLA